MARYNKDIAEQICRRLEEGETVQSVCRNVHIHKDTFYEWVKHKADFADAVNKARQAAYDRIGEVANQSIYRLLTGYDVTEERTVSVDTGKRDAEGKAITRVKEHVKIKKHIPPSAAAIIFTLCNRDPDHWKNRMNTEVTGKDGRELFAGLSDEELNARIRTLQKKLGEGESQ